MNVPGRLQWADIPALLLATVSAITVTTGARLLRGQNTMVMFVLGLGVAGSIFVLEKLIVERLSSARPRQSLLALSICWLPLLLFATALATFATFSWLVPEITRRDAEDSQRLHWIRESEKVSGYILALKTAVRHGVDTAVGDIDAERRRITAARRDGQPFDLQALGQLQRRSTTIRDLEKRVAAFQPLPIDVPPDAAARTELERVSRELADLQAIATVTLAHPPPLPQYEPMAPPPSDLQSVLAEETKKRSWRALTAWGTALWVELLPLLALWRGGRRIPLAVRVSHWREQLRATIDAVRGRDHATPLPFVIQPLQVRGIVRSVMPPEYTLGDCTPMLEQAVASLDTVLGTYEMTGVSNSRGDAVDAARPLLPQLGGEPLVVSVVEDGR